MGGNLLALVDDFDRRNRAIALPAIFRQRHDRVLDGDEVPIAEISRGAITALSAVVVTVKFHEAGLAFTNEPDRQQTHLVAELLLDVSDQLFPLGSGGGFRGGAG